MVTIEPNLNNLKKVAIHYILFIKTGSFEAYASNFPDTEIGQKQKRVESHERDYTHTSLDRTNFKQSDEYKYAVHEYALGLVDKVDKCNGFYDLLRFLEEEVTMLSPTIKQINLEDTLQEMILGWSLWDADIVLEFIINTRTSDSKMKSLSYLYKSRLDLELKQKEKMGFVFSPAGKKTLEEMYDMVNESMEEESDVDYTFYFEPLNPISKQGTVFKIDLSNNSGEETQALYDELKGKQSKLNRVFNPAFINRLQIGYNLPPSFVFKGLLEVEEFKDSLLKVGKDTIEAEQFLIA
jgi:hypothetical protein